MALGLVICAFCPAFLWPVMLGYLDVCGVVLTAILLNCALDWDLLRFSWRRNLIMAALSLALILARRWYAYYIVGFYTALGITALIRMFRKEGGFSWQKIAILAVNFATVAGSACLGILLLNPSIFSLFLGNNYRTAYNAFKGNGVLLSLWYLANHMGLLWIAAFFLGFILLLQKKEARLTGVQLVLAAGIATAFFLTLQDMGPHHQYLAIPTLLIFAVVFAVLMLRKFPSGDRTLAYIGFATVIVLNGGFAFFPELNEVANFVSPLTTTLWIYPKQLDNYDAYHRIYEDLEEMNSGKAASTYVVGEGVVLTPEYLRRINMPKEVDAAPYISVNNTANLQDGFPSQFFMADRILMADPFSTDFVQAHTGQLSGLRSVDE